MRMRHLVLTLGFILLFAAPSLADSIRIPIPPVPPPPPVPDFMREPPEMEVEFVAPPPPPFISVEVSHPDYWFYDDGRNEWFYYEKGRKRHYVKRHKYREDGRHFHASKKKWVKVDKEHASKKGWVKKTTVKKKVTVKKDGTVKKKTTVKKKWWRFWGD